MTKQEEFDMLVDMMVKAMTPPRHKWWSYETPKYGPSPIVAAYPIYKRMKESQK